MPLQLELTQSTSIPLELEGITPDSIRELDKTRIERLEIFEGNRKVPLGDFFKVSGSLDDATLRLSGNLAGVHWVGAKMHSGRIVIEGNVGRHVGSEMTGGEIEVHGSVSDWVGAEMEGGLIQVHGNAGHLVGAAYRGSAVGMRGGTIVIDRDAGNEIGHTMRRGMIAVAGSIGDLAGFNMLAGTILVGEAMGIRHAAGMRRGTLVFLSDQRPELLPTFVSAGRQRLLVTSLLNRELQRLGYPKAELLLSDFELFHGDLIEGGRGEIFVRARS